MNYSEMLFNRDERLRDKIKELEKENKTLKELNVCVGCNNNPDYKSIIDKAIEYIKDNASYVEDINRCVDDLRDDDCDELLKILKGGKNE